MDVVVFSWSGSLRDEFDSRAERIAAFADTMDGRDTDVGVVTEEGTEAVPERFPTDFVIPHVDDLSEVLSSLTTRYDKVFFVSDVKAELVTANQSGAFTVGLGSEENDAAELSGVGPNYVLRSLDDLEEVLQLEEMP